MWEWDCRCILRSVFVLYFSSFLLSFLIALQVFIIRVSISIATYIGVINELNVSWYAYHQ